MPEATATDVPGSLPEIVCPACKFRWNGIGFRVCPECKEPLPGPPAPEERAASLLRGHADNFKVKQFGLLLTREIAAAIRAAVAEKVEEIARVFDNHAREMNAAVSDGLGAKYGDEGNFARRAAASVRQSIQ